LLILTAQFLWRTRLRGNGWFVAGTLLGVILLGIGALQFAGGRITHLPRLVASFFGGESMGDATTDIRLALYRAGWRAFLDAPWLGHGWARLMSAPLPYLDPSFLDDIKTLHQLHNDVLNFAVTGGVAGVAILVVIILTPLVAALRSPPDALRPARIYGTAGLIIVYAGGGLTDLMFGQEYHTMLFVMLNAIVLGCFRETRTTTLARA
jgi:O-antigen ligase